MDKDRSDIEIISFTLGALSNIMCDEIEEDEIDIPADIGELSTCLS